MPQFMACAPSELNPEKFQEVFIEIEPAEVGTLVHEFAQRIVDTGEYSVEEIKARRPEDIDRALLLISNFFTLWNEAKLTMTSPKTELFHQVKLVDTDELELNLSGHIDLSQIDPDRAIILDYKSGRLHENHYHQIAAYAFLAWDYAGKPSRYEVHVAVTYLEDLAVTNYSFTAEDLTKWRAEVVAHVGDTRYTIGKKCAFCKIQGSCPAYREYTQQAVNFLKSDDAQKGKVGWMDVEPAERGSLVDAMYVVKKGMERVEISLKSALSGKDGNNQIDLGNGYVYRKTTRDEKVLNSKAALPILRTRFDQSHLDTITSYSLDDVLDLAAKFAPRGKKEKAREELLALLVESNAVTIVKKERHERRPSDETKPFKKA